MRPSPTLSGEALADLRRELKRSRAVFGPEVARSAGARLASRLRGIADGTAIDHRHPLLDEAPASFRCTIVPPILIIFNVQTRSVITIVDGRRDIAAIVAQRLRPP